jgi:hypothetical protein
MSAMSISLRQLSYSPHFSVGNEISTYLFHITEWETSAVEDTCIMWLPILHFYRLSDMANEDCVLPSTKIDYPEKHHVEIMPPTWRFEWPESDQCITSTSNNHLV